MTTTAVEWAATREAEALGHHWLGEEHLLLAVADEAGYDRDDRHRTGRTPGTVRAARAEGREGCMSAPS